MKRKDLTVKAVGAGDRFQVGDKVTATAFRDHRGKEYAAVAGLTVVEVNRIDSDYIPTYYRVKAVKDAGETHYVEAAESFFEPCIG